MDSYKTEPKTIMIYEDDNIRLKEIGIAPKNIVRLGLQAHKEGWSLAKETTQIEDLKQRISFIARTLDSYIRKTDTVVKFIKKEHNIGIDLHELTNEEVRRKLEDLE